MFESRSPPVALDNYSRKVNLGSKTFNDIPPPQLIRETLEQKVTCELGDGEASWFAGKQTFP